jgi:type IV pilus assembly protein PilY1
VGYFDPYKCYSYDSTKGWFAPIGTTVGYVSSLAIDKQPATSKAQCSGSWSGNFLNWATMQTIDMFRWAMTGGDRLEGADSIGLTVLERASTRRTGGDGQFPTKRVGLAYTSGSNSVSAVAPSSISPQSWSTLYLRQLGDSTSLSTAIQISDRSDFSKNVSTLNVRVKVCDSTLFPSSGSLPMESATTCTGYGTAPVNWKPTGLIQENAMTVRFAAFGYLKDDSLWRDGGVMRARMKFVGPSQPILASPGFTSNPNGEWDATTGIYRSNPDPSDASATQAATSVSVAQSGVIRYLNRFGRLSGYKQKDPVSEMYYETLRYYRGLKAPTAEYVDLNLITASTSNSVKVDGFPVIRNWDDPLVPPTGWSEATEWCPKNYVIGLSDSNTHRDKRLPGNSGKDPTLREGVVTKSNNGDESTWAYTPLAEPTNPDTAVNVSTWLQKLVTEENAEGTMVAATGNPNLGIKSPAGIPIAPGSLGTSLENSAYLAALAYWANVTDLRPDQTGLSYTLGKQTVTTFFVDVRERGSWGTGVANTDSSRRNQLWLTGKYGNFVDRNGNGALDAGDALTDENRDGKVDARDVWDRNGDWLPDGYFEASTPEALVAGLRNAFLAIKTQLASSSGVGLANRTIELQTGTGLYRVNYDPSLWTGSLIGLAYGGVDEKTGDVLTTKAWDAAEKIAAQSWDTGRVILTSKRSASLDPRQGLENVLTGRGIALRWNSLSAWQQAAVGSQSVLDWLRGRSDDAGLRQRVRRDDAGAIKSAVLGDIVDSEPRYVGPPAALLTDGFNPGYSAFRDAQAERRAVVYVGANDGMLHAIDATVDGSSAGTDGGKELFAYVPSFLFDGPTLPRQPTLDGLAALSSKTWVHRYYVNATPAVGDVDFARTATTITNKSLAADWRTVLVGGLGKGGRGFYALDVTDPAALTEANAASKVLWEFTDPDMGFSFGAPQIVKTKQWGWVVLLTSGYNSLNHILDLGSSGVVANRAQGFLYVIDIRNGTLLQKISTGTGTVDLPAGLAQVTAYIPEASDGTVSDVYGGDLLGNIFRWDFGFAINGVATTTVPAPTLLARLLDKTGGAQPVTSGPVIRTAPVSRNRYVLVGTGRLLDTTDLTNLAAQTVYALRDGTKSARWETSRLPSGLSFPFTRSAMAAATLLQSVGWTTANAAGWYHDLVETGERIIIDPVDMELGKVIWLSTIPEINNPCDPSGSSRLYAASLDSGLSQLYQSGTATSSNPVRVRSVNPDTGSVGLRLARIGGTLRAVVTGQYGELKLGDGLLRLMTPTAMNWREITEPGR